MTLAELKAARVANQGLSRPRFSDPVEVVRHLCAVQSQDFQGAAWALSLRSGWSNADIQKLYDQGAIIRTHIMRPTWHFVLPEDLRWMQGLTAPRVQQFNAYYYRQCGLDSDTLAKTTDIVATALLGRNFMNRKKLAAILAAKGIQADSLKLSCIMMYAELETVICNGPMDGKQFTYALANEWVPPDSVQLSPDGDEALALLARRYFTSHGPAELADFSWWSGLSMTQAARAVDINSTGPHVLSKDHIGDKTYYSAQPMNSPVAGSTPAAPKVEPREKGVPNEFEARSGGRRMVEVLSGDVRSRLRLLPNYDEYLVAYKDHGTHFDADAAEGFDERGNALFNHLIVLDGDVVGGWKRSVAKKGATVDAVLLRELDDGAMSLLEAETERFGAFMGVPASLSWRLQ